MAIVYGTNGSETINASDGVTNVADTIYGYGGNDDIFGLGGNDLIVGGAGADDIDGGAGFDTAFYTDSTELVNVQLSVGLGKGGTAEGDTFVSIENLYGSAYNDLLAGNVDDNSLSGMAGNDYLYGHAGADVLSGGLGDDNLQGDAGADTLYGGDGSDTLAYLMSTEGVTVSLLSNLASGGDAEGDTFSSIENLVGSGHDDTLYGDNGVNRLRGLDGEDTLKGFGGVDRLYGGEDDDLLFGMDGVDYLFGESGDDWLDGGDGVDDLHGGAGLDRLTGGSGVDTFVWESASETGLTTTTADEIIDFTVEADSIDLSAIDADVYTAGDQAFTFIGTAAFSGTPGEINYYHSGGDTYIQMQTGTAVDIEGVIRLTGIHTPEASWFVL